MNKLMTLFLIMGMITTAMSQDIQNMEMISNIQFNEAGNDIWGFVDSMGTEYAVIGTRTATRIYSLEDPANPTERYVVFGASSTWRDIKEVDGYLYVTTDTGDDGLTIIDVRRAHIQDYDHVLWQPTLDLPNGSGTLERVHNVYADVEEGIIYLAGHNISRRGVMLLDVKTDPMNPIYLSAVDEVYSHDAYVRDGVLYSSELQSGFGLYDITDPTNPVEIGRSTSTRNFTHNAWLSEDKTTLYTTDEKPNAFLEAYDVRDPQNITYLDQFQPLKNAGTRVIPHNAHTLNQFAVTSWYTDGVIITDMSKPDNIVQVAQYDTYFDEGTLNPNGNWFSGCWGAYPYLPSGLILASDIETGLYVFRADYVRACYLEGTVTSGNVEENGKVIDGVTVEILDGDLAFDDTNIMGEYKTGLPTAGTYRVAFSHPSYDNDTLMATLVNGEVTILDAVLRSPVLGGKVIDAETKAPIEGASVVIQDQATLETFLVSTDAEGRYVLPVRNGKSYDIYVGNWGHLHEVSADFSIESLNSEADFELTKGYQDDFFANLGWTLDSQAEAGNWTIESLDGTIFDGVPSNPEFDAEGDLGTDALVTGNGTTNVGGNDVDEGVTTATSDVMDWSTWLSAKVNLSYWFFNDGGAGTPPNDSLIIYLTNGSETLTLAKYTESTSEWVEVEYEVTPESISFSNEMRLIVTAGDYPEGHLVEGGIDKLLIVGALPSNTNDIVSDIFRVYPNPTSNFIVLEAKSEGTVTVADINGRVLITQSVTTGNNTINLQALPTASYLVTFQTGTQVYTEKVVKN